MSIISFDLPNARHRSRSPQRCRWRGATRDRSPAIIIDRPSPGIDRPSPGIVRHYRSSAIIIDRPSPGIDRPPLLSIARHPGSIARHPGSIVVQRQSSPQLINNDNRDRVRESATGGLSHPYPYLIIIIIY